MPMPAGYQRLAVAVALALSLGPWGSLRATETAPALSARSIEVCEQGREATDRDVREHDFTEGLMLAEQAVALDDENAAAHFAVFCNMGEIMRLDGESISSVFQFRRLMTELNRALELDPDYTRAMASKGILLVRLPRLLGGDDAHGERLLRRVIEIDPSAVSSRLMLAEQCRQRGEMAEASAFAQRALEIASEQGRPDKVEEAQSILAKISTNH